MAILALPRTGGLGSHPSVTSLLSAFTPRGTGECSGTTVQINTDHVIRLVQAVFGQQATPLPSVFSFSTADFHLQLCRAKDITT